MEIEKVISMTTTMERENTVSLNNYLNKLADADNKTKCRIENEMVDMGESIVPELVSKIQVVKGSLRGIIAMTLIRIGTPAVDVIKRAAKANSEFQWVADYLITEIGAAA